MFILFLFGRLKNAYFSKQRETSLQHFCKKRKKLEKGRITLEASTGALAFIEIPLSAES